MNDFWNGFEKRAMGMAAKPVKSAVTTLGQRLWHMTGIPKLTSGYNAIQGMEQTGNIAKNPGIFSGYKATAPYQKQYQKAVGRMQSGAMRLGGTAAGTAWLGSNMLGGSAPRVPNQTY